MYSSLTFDSSGLLWLLSLFFSAIIASCVLIVIFLLIISIEHLQCENSIMLLKIDAFFYINFFCILFKDLWYFWWGMKWRID